MDTALRLSTAVPSKLRKLTFGPKPTSSNQRQ